MRLLLPTQLIFRVCCRRMPKVNDLYLNAKYVLKGFPVSPDTLAKAAQDKLLNATQ
jgi:hypothetical protein